MFGNKLNFILYVDDTILSFTVDSFGDPVADKQSQWKMTRTRYIIWDWI